MKRKKRLGSTDKDPKPTPNNHQETPNNHQETTTDSGSKGKLGRRGFLKIGAGAAAVTLANPLESIAQRRQTTPLPRHLGGECYNVTFKEPTPVTCNKEGVLDYTLSAERLDWTYECGGVKKSGLQPVFNGDLPGPTLYIDPGSTINLKLTNNLDGMPPFPADKCPEGHHGDPPKPACFQHTNLHFHGFQVSPCSLINDGSNKEKCGPYAVDGTNKPLLSSDDVLIDVYPGKTNEYKVILPDMHAPGTNWYHSHLHGASAYQLSGGMAGAIIIREPTEEARMARQDMDKVFVLQEVLPNPPDKWPNYPPIYGRLGETTDAPETEFLINGQCRPTLKMNPNQNMRWRFINATSTPRGLTKLRLVKSTTCNNIFPTGATEDQLMHLIAIDGLSFYGIRPQPVRYHLMGPGNRADFIVNLKPGLYTLLKDAYPLKSVLDPGSKDYTQASTKSTRVLMYIHVTGESYDEAVPQIVKGTKPEYLKPIWQVDEVRKEAIKFQNPAGRKFQIDGKYYPDNAAVEVKVDTAEEWTLQNTTGVFESNTHPFHVHLNPFQIVNVPFDFEVDASDLPEGVGKMVRTDAGNWPFWDTVPLPAQDPPKTGPAGELKIRSRFLIYHGEYVTHCHILVHEDVGMMINVKLNGKGIGPNKAVHKYPDDTKECIERTSKRPT